MPLLLSPSTDPFVNLALEELIAEELREPTLLLWRNDNAVIIGRNQNPWYECNADYLRRNGIALCRRHSGGGAVFHDMGNINLSFFSPRSGYDKDKTSKENIRVVQDMLQSCNIKTTIANTSDILVNDRKVSGSAYRITKHYAYHHLTLLLSSNLEHLRASLHPPDNMQIEGNFVPSRRTSVMNLADANPELNWNYILSYISTSMNTIPSTLNLDDYADKLDVLQEQLQSDEWRFYRTPEFSCNLSIPAHAIQGEQANQSEQLQIKLNVVQGKIHAATPYPDSEYLQALCKHLLGMNLRSNHANMLAGVNTNPMYTLLDYIFFYAI